MWNQIIPEFIYAKRNITRLILLTAAFALVFINIYKPFNSESWYAVSDLKYFIFSSLIILTGVLVVVISRIILYRYTKNHTVSWGQYSVWILLEIFFMSLFYAIYTLVLDHDRDFLEVFKSSTTYTSLVLLLPYFAIHLHMFYIENQKKLLRIQDEREDASKRQTFYSFYDERNELRITIKRTNLLYIESADNYALIWYMNKGNLTKFVLRNSLKNIEESMEGTSVLRCHRSYIANFEQVKVIRRQKDGVYLEFGIEKVPDIPISQRYSEKVTQWFMTYSS